MSFFKKNKHQTKIIPTARGFYALHGQRAGDFLIFLKEEEAFFRFVYLPGGHEFCISSDEFVGSIKNRNIVFVEQLPQDIFEESVKLSLSIQSKM